MYNLGYRLRGIDKHFASWLANDIIKQGYLTSQGDHTTFLYLLTLDNSTLLLTGPSHTASQPFILSSSCSIASLNWRGRGGKTVDAQLAHRLVALFEAHSNAVKSILGLITSLCNVLISTYS